MKRSTVVAGLAALVAPRAARAQQLIEVKLALPPGTAVIPALYAQKAGLFRAAGLSVELQKMNSGAAIVAAVLGGSVQIGSGNVFSIVTAHAHGVPVKIIAGSAVYSADEPVPYGMLLVKKDGPIKTAADLNGKTLGASGLRGVAQFAPMAWVDQHGGQSSTLKFVELTSPEMLAAIPAGRIDAGLIIEPYIAEAKKTMRVFANCFDAIAPTFIISAHFCNLAWAQAHSDVVKRYAAAMQATAVWANAHHDLSAEVLIDVAHLKPDVLKTMTRSIYGEKLDAAQVQPVVDVTAKYTGSASFPAGKLIFTG